MSKDRLQVEIYKILAQRYTRFNSSVIYFYSMKNKKPTLLGRFVVFGGGRWLLYSAVVCSRLRVSVQCGRAVESHGLKTVHRTVFLTPFRIHLDGDFSEIVRLRSR